jgi:hypothetical protein|tara:strand:- start:790 stop:1131 length:342 start_codon:yes stop_codon:yes gene_type:complete
MSLDHEAIYEAYKSESKPVVTIDDTAGAFDADGNKVTLDDAKVAAARKSLDDAAALVAYKLKRTGEDGTTDTIYPTIGDQLDNLYKDIVAGTLTTSGAFATAIKATKDKYPKP